MSVGTRPSKTAVAYQHVRDRILSHEYAPGHRLVLRPIADELHMSVVPVREAVRQLEAEGMVTFKPHVGASVAGGDDRLYLATMQVLSVIEAAATGLSAPHLSASELAEARALNREMKATLHAFDARSFTRLNRAFHSLLFSRCPNERLLELVRSEWDHLDRLRESTFVFIPERSLTSVEEHEEILAAIEAGTAPAEIERLARAHRDATSAAYVAKQQAAEASTTA